MRPPGKNRMDLSKFRHGYGCIVGKRSMGRLLELGPKGNVGFCHMAQLSVLLTPTPIMLTPAATVWMVAIQLPTSSTLLVGHQLSSGCSGNEHTHLFLIDRPTKKNEFRAIVCYYPELVLFIH